MILNPNSDAMTPFKDIWKRKVNTSAVIYNTDEDNCWKLKVVYCKQSNV